MPLFLAFLAVPLIEIALFIQIGWAIGLWSTLGIVVLTALIGTWLVRSQGSIALGQLRSSFSSLDDPTEPLAHGAMILVAGALLLTPGFFTDAIGFALLIPGVRSAVFTYLRSRIRIQTFEMGSSSDAEFRAASEDVIEADFEEVPSRQNETHGPSGWTKH